MESAEDRFDELVARYLAGAESEAEFAVLQTDLRDSKAYRRRFLDASLQAQGCAEVCGEVGELAVASPREWKPVALTFAAAAVIVGVVLLFPRPEEPEAIGRRPDRIEVGPAEMENAVRLPSLVDPQPLTPGLVARVARSTERRLDPLILAVEGPEFIGRASIGQEMHAAWLEDIDLICAHRPGLLPLADDLQL